MQIHAVQRPTFYARMATIPATKVPFATIGPGSNGDCRDELNPQTKPGASHYPKCQEATACVMKLRVPKTVQGAQGLRSVPATWIGLVGSRVQVDGGPRTWLVQRGGKKLVCTMHNDDTL